MLFLRPNHNIQPMPDLKDAAVKFRPLDVFKYFIVAAVILFLSFLFPDNARFNAEFELGQTWHNDDLIAPFDFPVRKYPEELEKEKEKLLENFSPYYIVDTEIGVRQINRFTEEFERAFSDISGNQFNDVLRRKQRYLDYGQGFLNRQFRTGILSDDDAITEQKSDFVINIVRGAATRQQTVGNVNTLSEVEDFIQDSLPLTDLRDPDFLFYPLRNSLTSNLLYSDTLTELFKEDLLESVSEVRGKVSKGDQIILENGIVTDEIYRTLLSLQAEYEENVSREKDGLAVFFGYLLLTSLSLVIFMFFIRFYLPEVFADFSTLLFVFIWFVVFGWLVYAAENLADISVWVIPFSLVPILIKTFINDRLAFFTHVVLILIASILCSEGYEFAFLQILAGIVAVMSDANVRNWSGYFFSMIFIFLTYALGWVGLSIIAGYSFADMDYTVITSLFFNVFLTLLAFPLIPLSERIFGFTSVAALTELADMHRPLLKRLATEAPGTLQHSIQVGNLGAAVAAEIGADEILVKTAALYHDIGKIPNARFFIENQGGYNPHSELDEEESARIIIGHVAEGLAMAKKAGLPKILSRFITTHHGTTRAEYFYRQYLKNHPDESIDEEAFRYPGPLPVSKEETILMLADSLEASAKSLQNPTGKDIDELVDKIIQQKTEARQFFYSELTFGEMDAARAVFKKLLRSMNHVRIEYPEDD